MLPSLKALVLFEGLVFSLKVGAVYSATQPTTLPLPEQAEFTTQQMLSKGGFPVIPETTRNHTFSKEISQVIIAAMVLAPDFYCKICQRVMSAMRGNPP